MKKIYVLDTNILMSSPNALFGFDDNYVYLTMTVMQELDKHKNDLGEIGYKTREAIRFLDEIRINYSKTHEIGEYEEFDLPTKGKLFVIGDYSEENYLPEGCSLSVPDNRIINTALHLAKTKDCPVILVTNDSCMRFNAFAMSKNTIKIQDYLNETVDESHNYIGKLVLPVPGAFISTLFENISVPVEQLYQNLDVNVEIVENEYILLKANDSAQSALTYYKAGNIHIINDKHLRGFNNVRGRNCTQKMLMHALLAPAEEIPLVICKGPAGTGKTMLAIACGLDGTYTDEYERSYDQVMITRTNVLSDNDLGFLPGDLEEKMSPLVAPFMDNMLQIFAGQGKDRDLSVGKKQIEYVLDKEIVKIEAMGYMRGRSVSHTYLIVDEAQNMTVSQALEIISRAGAGTKVVLLGDPDQIDAKYLSKRNNGLVFASDKMKGSPLCAQVTFEQAESVRSPLAMEAAKRLTLQ